MKNKSKTFIIAEIGNNHEGNFKIAKKLVYQAAKCNVDAVKFQTFKTDQFINIKNKKRFKQLKKFELSQNEFYKLYKITKQLKLKFISTPFDFQSVEFLGKFVDCFKVSSGDNNFYQLIEKILKFKKPTIISTGFLNFNEIKKLIRFIKYCKFPLKKLTFLHCVSDYPVKDFEANLNSIPYLKKKLKIKIGYSDHTIGIVAPVIASTIGADVIEKHFTLNKNYSNFRDHNLSADPNEMSQMVQLIRRAKLMMGKNMKIISKSEKKNLLSTRRSIYASRNIKKFENFNMRNLKVVRSGEGLEPNKIFSILKKKAKIKINKNHLIKNSEIF